MPHGTYTQTKNAVASLSPTIFLIFWNSFLNVWVAMITAPPTLAKLPVVNLRLRTTSNVQF